MTDRAMTSQPEELYAFPLSFAQERMWFLEQLGSGVANRIVGAVELNGELHVRALAQAFQTVVQRHEALRTTFRTFQGNPVQVVSGQCQVGLPVQDVATESEVQPLVERYARRPFDLERGPLLRALLLRLGAQRHVLVVAIHHIVCDGWSLGVLVKEVATLYAAASLGVEPQLPSLPIQYADYAQWQREWLRGEAMGSQLAYWRKQLRGPLPVLELPTDRPRTPMQSHQGERLPFSLSADMTRGLIRLGRGQGATLFMVLLAAMKALLVRYTGQADVIVGTPVAGRVRPEIESLIGLFLNTLVLRTDASGDPSFLELLKRVRETAVGAYGNQDVPVERLVEVLRPERDPSRNPLFQVMFGLQNPAPPLEMPGLGMRRLDVDRGASHTDLALSVLDLGGSLRGRWEYNTDLFDRTTIDRMATHYERLLDGILAEPDRPISRLPLLTDGERGGAARVRLARPRRTFEEFPRRALEGSIPERFEAWVDRAPDRIAVKTLRHEWTYDELHRRSAAVARRLHESGAAGGRVGLLFDQDAPMISALMGALMSGTAYVPLDPLYPRGRLTFMLQDSGARVLLTGREHLSLGRELGGDSITLIELDEKSDASAHGEIPSPPPDGLAYILYTSGSTGEPKGVMQNQRNVLHHIRAYTNNLQIQPDDRLTLLSSYSFDAAVMDIFGALLNGATLCPLDVRQAGLDRLRGWLLAQGVTIYHSTPTLFRALCGGLVPGQTIPGVRLVVLGGEEVHRGDVEMYRRHFDADCTLVNGLGPTESTLALQQFITHATALSGSAVPVGYPVEDTDIWLLTPEGQRAAIRGEIGIRSAHLALGYWARPELTQAAFLPDPEGGDRRIYRTGDMGRVRPDGALEFQGRRDDQVKVRGFRVELGEIEAVLGRYGRVSQCAVAVKADPAGGNRLVAYVVPKAGGDLSHAEVGDFLRQRLPSYMLPAAFVVLERLPLTPNGKVDRRALPVPDAAERRGASVSPAPRTDLERIIAAVWQEVLHAGRVGMDDNFFDLGGHSLLFIQVQSSLVKALGRQISMVEMFQFPTVGSLAEHLSQPHADRPSFSEATERARRQKEAMIWHKQVRDERGKHP